MTTDIDLFALLHSTLYFQSLLASLLAGVIFGAIGPLMVWKRLGLMGDALSHASLTAAAVALIWGLPLSMILIPFAVLLSQLLAWIEERQIFETDAVLAVFFAGFLALGVLIMSFSGKGSQELVHLLLGDIITLETMDLILLAVVVFLVLSYLLVFRKHLILIVLQPDLARVEGLPVKFHNYAVMALAGLAVATGLKLMGVVLLTALMMVPPLLARAIGGSLRKQWVLSIVLASSLSGIGLTLAFSLDLPSGPSIAGLSLIAFLVMLIFSAVRKSVRRQILTQS